MRQFFNGFGVEIYGFIYLFLFSLFRFEGVACNDGGEFRKLNYAGSLHVFYFMRV
jgi:hypothetical protein